MLLIEFVLNKLFELVFNEVEMVIRTCFEHFVGVGELLLQCPVVVGKLLLQPQVHPAVEFVLEMGLQT